MFTYLVFSALLLVATIAEPPRLNSRFESSAPSQSAQYKPLPGHFILLQRLQNGVAPQPQGASNPPERVAPRPTEDSPRNNTEPEELEPRNSTEEPQRNEKLTEAQEQEGVYYIYHPDGLLQKVVYATNDDAQNMAFSARLRYQNVEPIKGPIFTYDPETFVFKRI